MRRRSWTRGPLGLTALALLMLLALGAGACGGDPLTIYSGRSQNLVEPILEQFAEETGIDIQVRYGDSAELALLIQEEGGDTRADVFLSQSPGPIGFLAEQGRLATLSAETLALGPSSPSGQWVAVTGRQRVLVYNSDVLGESELPGSIFDLTDEEWLGRVAFAPSNGSFQDFLTLFRLEVGDETALEWLTALAEGGAPTYGNNNAIVQAVARGEVEMGLVNHYYNLRLQAEDPSTPSENAYFASGDPGGVTIATAVGAIEGGDDRAEQLIAYLLSEDAQRFFAQETLEYPLATGLEIADAPALPPAEVDLGDFDQLGSSLQRTIELIREAGLDF